MTRISRLVSFLALMMGLVVPITSCAFPAPKPYDKADAVSVRLEQEVPGGKGICSGWIPPNSHHAIVTDEHCIDGGLTGWSADGRDMRIYKVLRDGNDHVILLVDLYFGRTATMGPKPARGDEVFTLGNPEGFRGLLLIGKVAGFVDEFTYDGWGTFKNLMIVDSRDWKGCSGAAIFDAQGRVVGTVNALYARSTPEMWRLTAAFGLEFSAKQYQEARRFRPSQEQLLVQEEDPPVSVRRFFVPPRHR